MGPSSAVLFGLVGGLLAEFGALLRWHVAWPQAIGAHLRRPSYYIGGGLWVLASGLVVAVVATAVELSPVDAVVIGISTSLLLQSLLSLLLSRNRPQEIGTVRPQEDAHIPAGRHVRRWSFVWPLALTGAAFTVLVSWAFARTLRPELALALGVVLVVSLGAIGLVVRGIGEELDSTRLKALGYYFGALAYTGTASVALYNGLPQLINR